MTFLLRPAAPEDIPVMQAIERDAARAFIPIGYDFCVGPAREDWEHRKGIAEGAALIAECGGEPAGFILLWPVDGHGHIVELSVALGFQKRGLGRALIDAGETWARGAGFGAITLTTFRDVSWNAPWYRALGYRDFEPGGGDAELAAIIAAEAAHGFHARPRTVMKKAL
ncbi:MAG: GNAT family N-acetyltransferase [Oricola sp.]|nr:GNAT family N-acetyltransferase [Oricola sp.]